MEVRQGAAVLERDADHGTVAAYPEPEYERFIAIRSVTNWDEIVTVIEVLSPANKRDGTANRTAYQAKQQDILYSSTSLVEIDLLHGGAHTVAVPWEQLAIRGKWDYLVVVHRPVTAWHFEYWFCRLQNALPSVAVPLTEGLADFHVDLQIAFDAAYDSGPYSRRVNYSANPPVEMGAASLAWISSWLTDKGIRQT